MVVENRRDETVKTSFLVCLASLPASSIGFCLLPLPLGPSRLLTFSLRLLLSNAPARLQSGPVRSTIELVQRGKLSLSNWLRHTLRSTSRVCTVNLDRVAYCSLRVFVGTDLVPLSFGRQVVLVKADAVYLILGFFFFSG